MRTAILHTLVRLFHGLARDGAASGPSDADLLSRFVHERDEAAFATLLERHARLVWGVCRGLLPNDADAEDAFQATCVALFRGATKIRPAGSLAPWLHTTATRIARKLQLAATRRSQRERRAARPEAAPPAVGEETWVAFHLAVHDEIARLPVVFRDAFVLCVLEGHRHEDAAAKLGVPVGTLSARVSRARKKLLERLSARGLTPAATAAAVVVGGATATAAAPEHVLRLVRAHLADRFVNMPPAILELAASAAGGVTMKGKVLLATGLLAASLTAGVGGVWLANAQDRGASPPVHAAPVAPAGEGEMEFEFHGRVRASERKVELAAGKKLTQKKAALVLPLRITSAGADEIKTTLAHEWHGGEWPPTSLFASVTPEKEKGAKPFTPVYLAGEDPNVPRAVTLAPGKAAEVELRMDWPGTGSVKGDPLIKAPGKYRVRFALVFEASGKRQYVVSAPAVVEFSPGVEDAAPFPGHDPVKRLREQLKDGTPREKEAALDTIRELKPIRLIPEVIEAIEDPTPLPRDGDTGWVFVGHQAATVLAEIARDIDGIEVGMGPGKRGYQAYSFHSDSGEGGKKLQELGRLAEVRKNWGRWWDAHRRK